MPTYVPKYRAFRRAIRPKARKAFRRAVRPRARGSGLPMSWRSARLTSGLRAGRALGLRGALAAGLAYGAYRTAKYARKTLRGKRRVASANPPTTTNASIPARYAVANTMSKFKAPKKGVTPKVPKSAMTHYKDYGMYIMKQCMYINHSHFSSDDRLWYTIAQGLTKYILGRAKIYCGKLVDDPCIGPLTSAINQQSAEQTVGDTTLGARGGYFRLGFTKKFKAIDKHEVVYSGWISVAEGENMRYRSFEDLTHLVKKELLLWYCNIGENPLDGRVNGDTSEVWNQYELHGQPLFWLSAVTFTSQSQPHPTNASIQVSGANCWHEPNMEDHVINLNMKTLIKMQNVTEGDTAATGGLLDAIDKNPLTGRIYSAKGAHPQVSSRFKGAGDGGFDRFFGNIGGAPRGFALMAGDGEGETGLSDDDMGYISHIPKPHDIYGNQTVKSATINFPAGSQKFHKTSFSLRRSFKDLAQISNWRARSRPGVINANQTDDDWTTIANTFKEDFGSHTMFGLTHAHKHGQDQIRIGYNVETDANCYIKPVKNYFPIKANYVYDNETIGWHTGDYQINPTEHQPDGPGIFPVA